jgi:outer membrane protein
LKIDWGYLLKSIHLFVSSLSFTALKSGRIFAGLAIGLGISLAAGLTAVPLPAAAQTAPKIGFVNTERILRESAPAKASQQKLEQEFSKREKSLQESVEKLRDMTQKIERDAAVMSEADRAKRQREAAELERDLQRRQREFREDLNQRRNEELAAVIERANRAIRQLAEAEKYDIILQEAVYASPKIDITEKIIRTINGGK